MPQDLVSPHSELARALAAKAVEHKADCFTFDDLVIDNAVEGSVEVLNTHAGVEDQEGEISDAEHKASMINNDGMLGQILFLLDSGVSQDRIERLIENSRIAFPDL
ncbi:hypothetical protein RYA05_04305 [Pseudomonas syringae pv. actinidiae]|nr:hypothetical protein [Pseudomonas syringae pv. actinidiae]